MYGGPVTTDPAGLMDWRNLSNVVLLRVEFKANDKFLKLENITVKVRLIFINI